MFKTKRVDLYVYGSKKSMPPEPVSTQKNFSDVESGLYSLIRMSPSSDSVSRKTVKRIPDLMSDLKLVALSGSTYENSSAYMSMKFTSIYG